MYQWQQLKEKYKEGLSIKGLARRYRLSKNTVRKYLRSEASPSMKKRTYPNLIDPFKNDIDQMLEKEMIGTRIFSELRKKGFKGSQSGVHRYLQTKRDFLECSRKMTTRFETEPGEQMQYDWKEWSLEIGNIPRKIYIHSLILSFSRKKFYVASLGITTAEILQALYEGILYFGGFAKELLIDNPKQMVLLHRKNGVIRYNDDFLRFCGLIGIKPNPCENYRPQTKGKVERPFLYLQEHFLKGLDIKQWGELEEGLKTFTEQVNTHYHTGIETTPNLRFCFEKPSMQTLPRVEPSAWRVTEIRIVSRDGYVSILGQFYPVPMRLCGKQVSIESCFGRSFRLRHLGVVVCDIMRRLDNTIHIPHPDHVKRNMEYKNSRYKKRSVHVVDFIKRFGTRGDLFLKGLRQEQKENLYWHLAEMLRYFSFYSESDIESVLDTCIQANDFHKNTVKRLLSKKIIKQHSLSTDLALGSSPRPLARISRPLSVYKELTHA